MFTYLLKKTAYMIPAFFAVTLVGFFFSASAPGDPVEIITGSTASQGTMQASRSTAAIKDSVRHALGLHLPLFYFSLGTSAEPDTLYKIKNPDQRKAMRYLYRHCNNPQVVSHYFTKVEKHENAVTSFDITAHTNEIKEKLKASGMTDTALAAWEKKQNINSISTALQQSIAVLRTVKAGYRSENVIPMLDSLDRIYETSEILCTLHADVFLLKKEFQKIQELPSSAGVYVPRIQWHGSSNQYHRWLVNLLHGNFGYSYTDGQPVQDKIWEKFFRSFILILISVFLAFLVSIPAGIYSARYKNSWGDKSFSWFSFILFSLPSYFAGTMLLLIFANNEYLPWFPEAGFSDPETYDPNAPFFQRMWAQIPFMVLPVITYTYSSFAFVSRLVRSSMLENLGADYIRTARAKGLSETRVLWKHALRNSLLPVITMFVNIFPAAIGGSVIIESVFSYPGMGLESISAVHHADHPMLISIVVFAGLMTMVAYFIADILYLWADPRISYTRK